MLDKQGSAGRVARGVQVAGGRYMGEVQCRGLMDSNSFPQQAWSTEYRNIMRAPQVVSAAAVAVVLLVAVAAAAVSPVAAALQVKQRMLSVGLELVTFRSEA